jgi:hypothetical protein
VINLALAALFSSRLAIAAITSGKGREITVLEYRYLGTASI